MFTKVIVNFLAPFPCHFFVLFTFIKFLNSSFVLCTSFRRCYQIFQPRKIVNHKNLRQSFFCSQVQCRNHKMSFLCTQYYSISIQYLLSFRIALYEQLHNGNKAQKSDLIGLVQFISTLTYYTDVQTAGQPVAFCHCFYIVIFICIKFKINILYL